MINVLNKYEKKLFLELKETNIDDAKEILSNSKKAFKELSNKASYERYEALFNISKEIERNSEDLAKTIVIEVGKPLRYARKEVKRASLTMLFSAEESKRIYGETIPLDVEVRGKNRFAYYNRVPIGPIYSITPFNDPLNLVAHKVGPAIAAGNSIINKPSTLTPVSGLKFNEIINSSDLPEYTMQTIISSGGGVVSNYFLTSDEIKMVTFTGGVEAAEKLIKTGGIKKYSMELGSNSPVIVCEDANLDEAAPAIIDAAFESQGQNCIHSQRILIKDTIYNDLKSKLIDLTTKLKVGNPLEESTDIGPMITEGEAKRVEDWVNKAILENANILIGGERRSNIYYPTILENVKLDSEIWKKEVFGPITILKPFSTIEEAIKLANDVPYGLQAGVYTSDLDNAMKFINNLNYGTVLLNDTSDFRIDTMPFGGMKKSGIGREGIRFAINEMTEIKLAIFRK